jgi:ABC-type branched-subunit amino acid transport system substrate-binding protein
MREAGVGGLFLFFLCLIAKGRSVSYRSTTFQSISPDTNQSQHTIRIGAPISYSPQDIYFTKGTLITNSWDLFVDWVNVERGGISLNGTNYSLSIQIIEDSSSLEQVQIVTKYLLDHEQVDFMFAPYTSPLTNASAFITEQEEFLLISAIAHPVYPNLNYTLFTLPTDLSRMKSTFHSFVSYGAKNVSVITENDHDNCLYQNTLQAALVEGITLYSHHTLDKRSPTYLQDLTDILLDLKENQVEVVIGCSISALCTHVCRH